MLNALGSSILNRRRSLSQIQFKMFFKLEPDLVQILYSKIVQEFPCSANHLLWTLYFLKTKNTNDKEIAVVLGIDIDTLHRHVVSTLRILVRVLPQVCFDYLIILQLN